MAIRLNVPLVKQSKNNTCWYACVCMLGYFRAPGPRQGLPDVWNNGDTAGLNSSRFGELARAEGLQPLPNANRNWTKADLEATLRRTGPLWCAGQWQGFPHVIVVTGVDDDPDRPILINDPAHVTPQRGALDWFNAKLDKHLAMPILYAPPHFRFNSPIGGHRSGVASKS